MSQLLRALTDAGVSESQHGQSAHPHNSTSSDVGRSVRSSRSAARARGRSDRDNTNDNNSYRPYATTSGGVTQYEWQVGYIHTAWLHGLRACEVKIAYRCFIIPPSHSCLLCLQCMSGVV